MHSLLPGLAGALLACGLVVTAVTAIGLVRRDDRFGRVDLACGAALLAGACALGLMQASSQRWVVAGTGIALAYGIGYVIQARTPATGHGQEKAGSLDRWLSPGPGRREPPPPRDP